MRETFTGLASAKMRVTLPVVATTTSAPTKANRQTLDAICHPHNGLSARDHPPIAPPQITTVSLYSPYTRRMASEISPGVNQPRPSFSHFGTRPTMHPQKTLTPLRHGLTMAPRFYSCHRSG